MILKNALLRPAVAITLATLAAQPNSLWASSHREAPITALDHKADITDWYAFVSPEHCFFCISSIPNRITRALHARRG